MGPDRPKYPWETYKDIGYETKEDFIRASLNKVKAERIWKARQLLAEIEQAIQSDRVRYWFPSKPQEKEKVVSLMQQIDEEWGKESRSRDRRYHGSPRLSALPFHAQACIAERLHDIFKKVTPNSTLYSADINFEEE